MFSIVGILKVGFIQAVTALILVSVATNLMGCNVQRSLGILEAETLRYPVSNAVIPSVIQVNNIYFEYDHFLGIYSYEIPEKWDSYSIFAHVKNDLNTWIILEESATSLLIAKPQLGREDGWVLYFEYKRELSEIYFGCAAINEGEFDHRIKVLRRKFQAQLEK